MALWATAFPFGAIHGIHNPCDRVHRRPLLLIRLRLALQIELLLDILQVFGFSLWRFLFVVLGGSGDGLREPVEA